MSASRYRLGVDVGGTHTDLVLLDTATGELLIEKVSSTPKNPALGVLNGVAKFIGRGIAPDFLRAVQGQVSRMHQGRSEALSDDARRARRSASVKPLLVPLAAT